MNNSSSKVGVVIVSYNASEAVRMTLSSISLAKNHVSFNLILVDNASEDLERQKIKASLDLHIGKNGNPWRFIQTDKNLGFSGGNNVGISEFLEDDEISHVCLLNSDVIVTDHWLDRLLEKQKDVISAVTNKADGEQCIPVDYLVEFSECLDTKTELINEKVYSRITDFADRWNHAWSGNIVETDVTFFCVLISRRVLHDIGLLDTTFFPGGFEDDDYCIRARKAGYGIHLARDSFIHHWGSASFGQLQYEYFSDRAQRNKEYLEKKHGLVWQRRPEKPFVSFAMDIAFVFKTRFCMASQISFLMLYKKSLTALLEHFECEFIKLRNSLKSSGYDIPEKLGQLIITAEAYGDLRAVWDSVITRVISMTDKTTYLAEEREILLKSIAELASGVHDRVETNFAVHEFLASHDTTHSSKLSASVAPSLSAQTLPVRPTTKTGKFFWILVRGLKFIFEFNGIVFFGGYFYPERKSDGYFQRIQIVDRLFTDRWRVYVESDELVGRNVWFDRPEQQVLVLRITGGKKRRWLIRILALLAVLRCRKIYYHSVLRMHDNRFGLLMRLWGLRKAIDIHGVVPEEFRMHNDFYSAVLYEKEERLAVEKAGMVIVVTESMKQYLQQKYRDALKGTVVSFPIFPGVPPTLAARPYIDGKPVIVYAGGLHKWQQVPKMIDAIKKTSEVCYHRFYCPDPQTVRMMLPEALSGYVTVEAKTHAELMELYAECHYGFILREDIIVNRVACPTKLVEYLAMGIVPIIDCEDIGDFKSFGMKSILLDDFISGRLPDEPQRAEMASENFRVYEHLKAVRQTGANEIYDFFMPRRFSVTGYTFFMIYLRRLLPPDTVLGRSARAMWRGVKRLGNWVTLPSIHHGESIVVASAKEHESLAECDIMVQVDNFEAGGLENVVIDLNSTLENEGYRVVLLVLGVQGAAVLRAKELVMRVVAGSYADDWYAACLDQLKPKIVITHYSFKGHDICKQKAIPFVQVIHNTYMWFNEMQNLEFAKAAANTTAFVAVSDYVKSYSVARLSVDPHKCVVISNGIDFQPFKGLNTPNLRNRLRFHYGIEDDEFVFLDVGAINHQKNHLGAIRAFQIAEKSCTRIRMVILGPVYETDLLKEMQAYIEASGLKDRVSYIGSAPSAHEHLAMADAFVSGTFFEGGPLTLLESVRSNLPIVMSGVGVALNFKGMPGFDIVEPVYDITCYKGFIWEMKSTPEFEQRLAEAMIQTWKNPVRPDFSVEQLANLAKESTYNNYIKLVADIIEKKPALTGTADSILTGIK